MARVAILLPRDEMLDTARRMAERHQLDVLEICAVHTSNVLEKLRQVTEAGAEIIIARGVHAMMIRNSCALPLVEIRLTGLEIALLVSKTCGLVNKPLPKIALIGFRNMFGNFSRAGEIPGAQIVPFFIESTDELEQAVNAAVQDGADAVIGGDTVCSIAAGKKIPSVFIESGEESMEEACHTARRLSYALDMEQRNTAEFRAILDYTFSGIIQIDRQGSVVHLNQSASRILGSTEEQAHGKPIWELAPALNHELLGPVLEEGRELYAAHLKLQKATVMVSVAPVLQGEAVASAIISLTEGRQLETYDANRRNELLLQGYSASYTFEELASRAPCLRALIERAKLISRFRVPVLLLGEFGTEKDELVQCIYNASEGANQVLVSFDCGSASPERVEQLLFGEQGLVSKAQNAIYLRRISQLSPSAQYKVFQLIAPQRASSYGGVSGPAGQLRLFASDDCDLSELVRQGGFREDLYYALNAAVLHVPPLRERPEDILRWGEYFLQELQKLHGRYIHLSSEAWRLLRSSPWNGNLAQLRNICERLVVLSPRRNVDEVFLQTQLRETFPAERRADSAMPLSGADAKTARLQELLEKYHGNRTAIAHELGVSKTTLWRYLKKLEASRTNGS